jgi:hypothetical protein
MTHRIYTCSRRQFEEQLAGERNNWQESLIGLRLHNRVRHYAPIETMA